MVALPQFKSGLLVSVLVCSLGGMPVARAESACPNDFKTLVAQLLQDLPSYTNRVRIRAGVAKSYVMIAARPEFQPLPLIPTLPNQPASEDLQQVFFTTLIRTHERDRLTTVQEYHWLFLTQPGPHDWRFVMQYSTLGPYPSQDMPPLPPRESSQGSVAQGVRDWLLHCRTRLEPTN